MAKISVAEYKRMQAEGKTGIPTSGYDPKRERMIEREMRREANRRLAKGDRSLFHGRVIFYLFIIGLVLWVLAGCP